MACDGKLQHQPRADGAERIAVPAAAIVTRRDVDQRVADDDEQAERARTPGPAEPRITQETLMLALAHTLGLPWLAAAALEDRRSEERRVGKEAVSTL